MRATEGSCLLTQQGRGSIRGSAAEFRQCIMEEHGVAASKHLVFHRGFRSSSPGTINASDDEGQLLAYSDPASADAQGLSQLVQIR